MARRRSTMPSWMPSASSCFRISLCAAACLSGPVGGADAPRRDVLTTGIVPASTACTTFRMIAAICGPTNSTSICRHTSGSFRFAKNLRTAQFVNHPMGLLLLQLRTLRPVPQTVRGNLRAPVGRARVGRIVAPQVLVTGEREREDGHRIGDRMHELQREVERE